MSSTYSPDLRIELIGTGDQAGVWGATTNNNMAYVLEQAIAGYVSVAVDSTAQALTYLNGASSTAALNQSVHAAIALTTGLVSANFAIYAPPSSKQYVIYNATSYTATIYNSTVIGNTTAAGTGVAIPAGKVMTVWSDGTNFAQQNTHLISPTLASPTMTTPTLGTPASGTLTNCTGLPVSTGISGLGSGVATFLATPSSANLASAVSDETGSGALVFANSPTLVTPALGTPSSGTLTNCTGLPIGSGVSGLGTGVATFLATPSSANLASAVSDETGSGALVFANSPTLVTPNLGTPSTLVGTNITGTASGLSIGGNAATATTATTAGTCSGNAATATLATKASTLAQGGGNGTAMTFNWSGQSGQPSWLWGSNDGSNVYVYNPSNFNVNYATSAGSAGSATNATNSTYATYPSSGGSFITSSNIGSQSVNYAATAGNGGVTSVDSTTGGVTLASLAAFTRSLAADGYQKLPGGLTIQWGRGQYTTNATYAQTSFPIAFASVGLGVWVIVEAGVPAYATVLDPSDPITTTYFRHFTYSDPTGFYFRWIAIGY